MPTQNEEIAICSTCKSPMDVSVLPPYTNVSCPTCGANNRVKSQIDQYVITGRKGIGGMSVVFQAKDQNLDREVAIKILNEQFSSDTRRISQFEQEAKITAGISHPHVVRVYTVGQAFSRYYIAMEMVSGNSLEDILTKQKYIPEAELIPIMAQVTEGLAAAYSENLIHRDIKPGNILIDGLNKAKIVDFGLALVTQGGVATADEIWATPWYVPPETLLEQPEDFRSDIYALCATIYHCLAGKPPFKVEEKTVALLTAAKQAIPPLKELAPHLSPAICEVIDKGMQYDAANRFESYDELLAAILFAEDNIGVETAILPTTLIAPVGSELPKGDKKINLILPILIGVMVIVAGSYFIYSTFSTQSTGTGGEERSANPSSGKTIEIDIELKEKINVGFNDLLLELEHKNYEGAVTASNNLMELPNHPEPSATISGIHGIVAPLIGGKLRLAKDNLLQIQQHIEKTEYTRSSGFTKSRLSQSLEQLALPEAEEDEKIGVSGNREVSLILKFALAVKLFSRGDFENSEKHFRQFSRSQYSREARSSKILDHYKKLTALYIEDIATAKSIFRVNISNLNEEELQTRIQSIKESTFSTTSRIIPKLRLASITKASERIRFLKKQRENVVVPPEVIPEATPKTLDDVLSKINDLISSYNFKQATQELRQYTLEDEEETMKQNALLYLLEQSSIYRDSFTVHIGSNPIDATISNLRGNEYPINKFTNEGVQVKLEEENLKVIKWHNVQAKSLLQLYPTVSKELEPEAANSFLENATCFAFLTKEYTLAQEAASALLKKDPSFSAKWDFIQLHFSPESDPETSGEE